MKIARAEPAVGSDDRPELLFGLRTIREVLRAGNRPLHRILVIRPDRQFAEVVAVARSQGIPIVVEPRERLDRLVPQGRHQGIIGLVAAKSYADAVELVAYAQKQEEPPFLLVLDGIEDPQNLGAVVRSAESAGVHGVFIPERRAVGLTPSVAKASAGALEHMQVARCTNIGKLIEYLREQDIPAYALDHRAEKAYTELDFSGPVALVLGAEGRGIRPGVLGKCEDQASIPMRGQVASLNVSASAAVVLFEVVRQRKGAARANTLI